MYRLIWVFAGYTGLIVSFILHWLRYVLVQKKLDDCHTIVHHNTSARKHPSVNFLWKTILHFILDDFICNISRLKKVAVCFQPAPFQALAWVQASEGKTFTPSIPIAIQYDTVADSGEVEDKKI